MNLSSVHRNSLQDIRKIRQNIESLQYKDEFGPFTTKLNLRSVYDNPQVIESTGNPLNMSIRDNGFFIIMHPYTKDIFYTRKGDFTASVYGNIVNEKGYLLMGMDVDQSLSPIQLNTNPILPKPTTEIDFSDAVLPITMTAYDKPATFTIDAINRLGIKENLDISFTKLDLKADGQLDNLPQGTSVAFEMRVAEKDTPDAIVAFDHKGKLISDNIIDISSSALSVSEPDLLGDDLNGHIKFIFGNASNQVKVADFLLNGIKSNGQPLGQFQKIHLSDGEITGLYSSGHIQHLYTIPTAEFYGHNSLVKVEDDIFKADSDVFINKNANIMSGSLEKTNERESHSKFYFTTEGLHFEKNHSLFATVQGYKINDDLTKGVKENITLDKVLYLEAKPTTDIKVTHYFSATQNMNYTVENSYFNLNGEQDSLTMSFKPVSMNGQTETNISRIWEVDYGTQTERLTFNHSGQLVGNARHDVFIANQHGITQSITVDYSQSLCIGEDHVSLKREANGHSKSILDSVYLTYDKKLMGIYNNGVKKNLYQLAK